MCPVDPYVDNTYYEAVKQLEELVSKNTANLTLMGIEPTYPSENTDILFLNPLRKSA